jgi:hypothetical protein
VITISNNEDGSLSFGYGNKNHVHHMLIALHGGKKQMLVTSSAKQHEAQVKNTYEKYSCYKISPSFFLEHTTKGNFENNGDKM